MKRKITAVVMTVIMFLTIFPIVATSDMATLETEASVSKLIAITFDDGPSAYTGQLLDGLKERGAKATFFMNGVNGANGTKNHMDLLERMINEGHQLANHTYSHHVPFSGLSGEQMANEEQLVESYLFTAMGGEYTDCVRIPGGARSDTISSSINAPMILWSVDTRDWADRNSDTVYSRIVSGASDGAIVLCHDLYPTTINGALRAISTLQSQGYEFVTVAELFRRRGITLENGSTYNSAPNSGTNLPAYQEPYITINPAASGKVNITLSSPDNIPLYYTTDGSEPTLSSSKYTEAFQVGIGTIIKVKGIDKYGTRTDTVTKVLTDYFNAVFNASYYAEKYPDLKSVYGTDSDALLNHFLLYGLNEGRQASPAFDINYYMDSYPDLQNAYGDNKTMYVDHFKTFGMAEGRQASPLFNVETYRENYEDLNNAYGNDLAKYYTHYSLYGYNENRSAVGYTYLESYSTSLDGVDYSSVYDYNYYIEQNPEVIKMAGANDVAVLKYFINHGMNEGQQASPDFNLLYYKNNYGDLISAFGDNSKNYYLHFIKVGQGEGRIADRMIKNTIYMGKDYSDEYDFNYYYSNYPDLQKALGKDEYKLLEHYVNYGIKEGRKAK
ncbi:MAG: polysaccharide deacetylase family protein [Lachnospiraceae bacterium]|nr:polysaccharide deacetylase family protein [Lachnospiraceae bacterium]